MPFQWYPCRDGDCSAGRKNGRVSKVVTVRFEAKDVVRHPMVQAIVEAYERDATEQRGAAGLPLDR